MADFVLHAASALPARITFARLVDWDAHSPITGSCGDGFTGRFRGLDPGRFLWHDPAHRGGSRTCIRPRKSRMWASTVSLALDPSPLAMHS